MTTHVVIIVMAGRSQKLLVEDSFEEMWTAHIHEGIKHKHSIHKMKFKSAYLCTCLLTLLFMQFILYCMVITIYNIKLIHPIDQSASRDLYTIESCHHFSCHQTFIIIQCHNICVELLLSYLCVSIHYLCLDLSYHITYHL